MTEHTGWLLDVYPGGEALTVWVLGDDGVRRRLVHDFPLTFYASAPAAALRQAWRWFSARPEPLRLARSERTDLFCGATTVLAVECRRPADQPRLFRAAWRDLPELTWYDADLALSLRYAAAFGVFPLGRICLELEGERIRSIAALDSPWETDPAWPALRSLSLEPDCDPAHAAPRGLVYAYNGHRYRQPFEPLRALLVNLRSVLERYDPDLLLTAWGDTWLLPWLLKRAQESGLPLPLNRDAQGAITRKQARSYHAYGQVIYRGAQVHLAGRWHVDVCNAVMYHDYGLEGVLELARITGLPVQTTARVSPGTGISSMQILTALRRGVLVPWRKQQAESERTPLDLVRSDMGGLVYQPTVGLHADVAEVDFVSMYPSVMAHFNISPETVLPGAHDPATGLPLTRPGRGLVPETLEPLLRKRIALKTALLTMPDWDPRRKRYKAWTAAYKWLLVTCFGYLGYKNARFGRIEAHEAVTAYGREAILRAKEAAEDLGCEVLHIYVDGMWVKRPGWRTAEDFRPLLEDILERTGLPIALDGVLRWVAFLPSRVDPGVPVANRYFGVFQSGEVKARGIELRRHDTCAFIRAAQEQMLEILARAPDAAGLPAVLPALNAFIHSRLADLRRGRIPPEQLIVRQTLSRALEQYRSPSPAALAARQLQAQGSTLRPGQSVRFIYTLGDPGVRAWDLPGTVDPRSVNLKEYEKLMRRAVDTVLELIQPAQPLQPRLVEAPAWRSLPLRGGVMLPVPAGGILQEAAGIPG